MKKIIFTSLFSVFSLVLFAQSNYHNPGELALRAGSTFYKLDDKNLNTFDFHFTYMVNPGDPTFCINSKFSYHPDYIEFNAFSLLGTGLVAMMEKTRRDEIKAIMKRYNVSEEKARDMRTKSDGETNLNLLALLLALESASVEIPIGRKLAIEPEWSLLRFKRYKPLYSSFAVTGSAGLSFNIYFSDKCSLNSFVDYNWLYSKKDPSMYKGWTVGAKLSLIILRNISV
ncbi:hypothetical protein FACS189434_07150 [Bacteroidia bacterium]|nr:hypothetical protein FACS189434_07150 [Bacteroidia bacterium]